MFKQLLWTGYYYVFVLAVIAVASSLTNQVNSVTDERVGAVVNRSWLIEFQGKSSSILAYKAINSAHDPFTVDKVCTYVCMWWTMIPNQSI